MNTSHKPQQPSTPAYGQAHGSTQEGAGQAFLRRRAEVLKTARPPPLPETWATYHDTLIDDLD